MTRHPARFAPGRPAAGFWQQDDGSGALSPAKWPARAINAPLKLFADS